MKANMKSPSDEIYEEMNVIDMTGWTTKTVDVNGSAAYSIEARFRRDLPGSGRSSHIDETKL
jgi:hypothetical protein